MHGSGGDAFVALIAPCDPEEFFASTWQQQPRVFTGASWSTRGGVERPLPQQTWADCCDHLGLAWGAHPDVLPPDGCDILVFKGTQITHDYDDCGPWEALLDSASCVVNHAELIWPPLGRLCLKLRERLLHVYANTYVTPPSSQAVRPHADDRDVFVVQLCGSKHWRVYGDPPIKLPYTEEQVGKENFEVPPEVLSRKPLIEVELQPGDVLYMPRGFVHEAQCQGPASSWHATLAVATHDWSWTKVFTAALATALDAEAGARWRAAVPLSLGRPGAGARGAAEVEAGRVALEELSRIASEAVSMEALRNRFAAKLKRHSESQIEGMSRYEDQLRKLTEYFKPGCREEPEVLVSRRVVPNTCVRLASDADGLPLQVVSRSHVGRDTRGKGKGKGPGKGARAGQLVVRSELQAAVEKALQEVEHSGAAGVRVGGLCGDDSADMEFFDELARLCFARACVCGGTFDAPASAAVGEAFSGASIGPYASAAGSAGCPYPANAS